MFSSSITIAVFASAILATTHAQTPTSSASAAAASASILASLPACGVPCVKTALRISGCELTDQVCVCQNTAFLCPVVACEAIACTDAENDAISSYTRGYCAPSGGRNFSPVCPASSNSSSPGTNSSSAANSTSTFKPSVPANTVAPYPGLAARSAVAGCGVLGLVMVLAVGAL